MIIKIAGDTKHTAVVQVDGEVGDKPEEIAKAFKKVLEELSK